MKNDIRSDNDIKQLVDCFYDKVKADDLIGYIFNDIYKIDWEKHLPVMYRFWENVVFYNGAYHGKNPLNVHQSIHAVVGLTEAQFDRWLDLFVGTVDELFSGKHAILAKQRATNITAVMRAQLFGGTAPPGSVDGTD